MGLFSSKKTKTNPDDIGRTVPPTPAQAKRYGELRKAGVSSVEAARTVRDEARKKR